MRMSWRRGSRRRRIWGLGMGGMLGEFLVILIPATFAMFDFQGSIFLMNFLGLDSPGRWFAVLMLKMIVAYVTLHYDIEAAGPMPKMRVIGDAVLPPMSATIRVRRRRVGDK